MLHIIGAQSTNWGEVIVRFLREKIPAQIGMLVILLVVSWAGARNLTATTIWYDEWYSLYYAGAAPEYGPISIPQTIDRALQYNEYNPPGYYIALNLWGQVAGWTPFAARAFSVLMGVLAVAVVYRLGNLIAGKIAGLGAAIGLGASAFFIHQLTELRMYTLFPLLVALTLLAYWQFMYRKASNGGGALFFVALLGLLYTHYMALPLIMALGIYHLIVAPKNRPWWVISGLAVICGLLYVPWLGVAYSALSTVSSEGSRNFYASDALTLINNILTQFSNGSVPLLVIVGWFALRGSRRSVILVLGLLLGTLSFILIVNERLHFIGIARYLLGLWPVLALVVGLGIAQMQCFKVYPRLLMLIWCMAGLGLIIPRTLIPEPAETFWQVVLPWDKVASVMNESFFGRANDEDGLVFLVPQPTPYWFHAPLVDYYLHQFHVELDNMPGWLHLPTPETPLLHAHLVESMPNLTPDQYASEAEQFIANQQRIWLAYSPTDLPSPFARPAWESTLTKQGFVRCTPIVQEATLRMDLYARLDLGKLNSYFGTGIEVGLWNKALSPDKQLSVLLGWLIEQDVPTNTYSIGVYVENAQGQPVAQSDFGIPTLRGVGPSAACTRTSISLAGLPSGNYTIHAAVYNWQTGERLIASSVSAIMSDHPRLSEIDIP